MKNDYIHHSEENINTGIRKITNEIFDKREILEIGGNYRNRYAIVK